jgi:hypothetical protein
VARLLFAAGGDRAGEQLDLAAQLLDQVVASGRQLFEQPQDRLLVALVLAGLVN